VNRRNDAENFSDEEIELVLDVNFKSTIVSSEEFEKPSLANKDRIGKIINVASIISFVAGTHMVRKRSE
jgi:2-deoxy-D-gluconate 3-dehydrogenase